MDSPARIPTSNRFLNKNPDSNFMIFLSTRPASWGRKIPNSKEVCICKVDICKVVSRPHTVDGGNPAPPVMYKTL